MFLKNVFKNYVFAYMYIYHMNARYLQKSEGGIQSLELEL